MLRVSCRRFSVAVSWAAQSKNIFSIASLEAWVIATSSALSISSLFASSTAHTSVGSGAGGAGSGASQGAVSSAWPKALAMEDRAGTLQGTRKTVERTVALLDAFALPFPRGGVIDGDTTSTTWEDLPATSSKATAWSLDAVPSVGTGLEKWPMTAEYRKSHSNVTSSGLSCVVVAASRTCDEPKAKMLAPVMDNRGDNRTVLGC